MSGWRVTPPIGGIASGEKVAEDAGHAQKTRQLQTGGPQHIPDGSIGRRGLASPG